MNIDFWNSRYSKKSFAYGTTPNDFLKEVLNEYQPVGNALFAAEGEGRNAVYAATKGLKVDAFDISSSGKLKAEKLAHQSGVDIHYQVGTLEDVKLTFNSYDVIGLIYAHFAPPVLEKYHRAFAEMLAPGGLIILEAFSKSNLERRLKNPAIGGPDKPEMLFDEELILRDFGDLEILRLEDVETHLSEGDFHNGMAKVIRFVGRKSNK